MNTKIKVLHILWSAGIGGAEEYVVSLAKYFDSSEYTISICVLYEKGELFDEMKKRSSTCSFIGLRRGVDISGTLAFIRYLHKEDFDIIHLLSGISYPHLLLFFGEKNPDHYFSSFRYAS